MGDETQPNGRRRGATRKCKTTTKAGCRTCKLRKVKCDEGRPACRRCVTSNRVCDGYGVWGGGGLFTDGLRQNDYIGQLRINSRLWIPVSGDALSTSLIQAQEEEQCFEWFKCRTLRKIPGPFALDFWTNVVFPASLQEPAVLHALLTLSAVHKREVVALHATGPAAAIMPRYASSRDSRLTVSPSTLDQVVLQSYIKAIHHLQPHLSIENRASVRIAIISCIIFVTLEFLRGHYETALIHLKNGLQVIRDLQGSVSSSSGAGATHEGILLLKPPRDPTDVSLHDTLSRICGIVELFKQTYEHPCLIVTNTLLWSEPCIQEFGSLNEAWRVLERLVNKVIHLTDQHRRHRLASATAPALSELQEQQREIRAGLAHWLKLFDAARPRLEKQQHGAIICYLMRPHHVMATIMADTCLRGDDESVFDANSERFTAIIRLSAALSRDRTGDRQFRLPGRRIDMSRSMADLGWLPALYYTALRCRDHRIRLQAIRLLEQSPHRECIWDSRICACVALVVVEIEEGREMMSPAAAAASAAADDTKEEYNGEHDENVCPDLDAVLSPDADAGDGVASGLMYPVVEDDAAETVPPLQRVHDVKVVLPEGPTSGVSLLYRQRHLSPEWKEIPVPIRYHWSG
ncbi:hypothetical protein BX600DRAFT_148844 [Xylariales sp. PMI_506]|nr:hypothetical protein BX600DRAFT_148844 [Xylariales sp. PMI_506]